MFPMRERQNPDHKRNIWPTNTEEECPQRQPQLGAHPNGIVDGMNQGNTKKKSLNKSLCFQKAIPYSGMADFPPSELVYSVSYSPY
jgi:hypothetical protein